MTSDNERAIKALDEIESAVDMIAALLSAFRPDVLEGNNTKFKLIRTALQRDDSAVEEIVEALADIQPTLKYGSSNGGLTERSVFTLNKVVEEALSRYRHATKDKS